MSDELLRKVLESQSDFRERMRRRLESFGDADTVRAKGERAYAEGAIEKLKARLEATTKARDDMATRYEREIAQVKEQLARHEASLANLKAARRTTPAEPAKAPARTSPETAK